MVTNTSLFPFEKWRGLEKLNKAWKILHFDQDLFFTFSDINGIQLQVESFIIVVGKIWIFRSEGIVEKHKLSI